MYNDWKLYHCILPLESNKQYVVKVGSPNGKRWDVGLDFVRQFKSELVRRLEGLVFKKKSLLISG